MNANSEPKQKGDVTKPDSQQSGEGQQYGEGNYRATKDYNAGLKDHVENHDIEKEARDAAPRNDQEAREMEEAERIGRSHSKGEGAGPDDGKSAK